MLPLLLPDLRAMMYVCENYVFQQAQVFRAMMYVCNGNM